jgi:hypothetical protein
MNPSPRTSLLATAVAAALAVSGCATPYVVKLPDMKPATSATSIEKVLDDLDKTRKVFREAVASQIGDEHGASNAFIGAGALITAMALGNVHRDSVLGVAAVAGTGYALANNNLPRTRLQIHMEAVKALNCAERAALPLAISDKEGVDLAKALDSLRDSRMQLSSALDAARAVRTGVLDQDPFVRSGAYAAAETSAVALLEQTGQSLKAGDGFLDASTRAARLLASSVTDIRDSALSALASATPPLAAVPQLVQGLAKDMGSFAPGAGIDVAVADALKKFSGGVSMSGVGSESPLKAAMTTLNAGLRETSSHQAAVNAALRGRNTTFADDAFKDCNVAQVVSALAVSPPSLTLSGQTGGQRVLDLKGGVRPYFLQLDGEPVPGLSFPTGPIRGGQAEITLKAGAVSTAVRSGLRVSDSSAAGQGLRIELEVSAAAAPASAASAAALPAKPVTVTPKPAAAGIDTALAALKKKSQFTSGGVNFQRKDLPVKDGDRIKVTVLCPDGNTAVFQRSALAASYLSTAGVMDFPQDRLVLTTEPPTCAPS